MLTIHAASRRFPNGTHALADVSLRIGTADRIVLLGPSGCGKSTLLRLVAGLDRPDSGTLDWDAGHPPPPGGIGFVFQDPTLLPWATAAENVGLPLRLRRVPDREAAPMVHHALSRVGLAHAAQARPRELSGGMRMRVSVARALVARPTLLLMDEPFAALDEFTRQTLQDDLLSLQQDAGCSLVFVTHSVSEAAYVGTRIVLMAANPGRIATELPGAPARLARTSPDYFALINRLSAAAQEARRA